MTHKLCFYITQHLIIQELFVVGMLLKKAVHER